ncbi:MAG: bestrophin family ion channel [Myxococcota bacterium]
MIVTTRGSVWRLLYWQWRKTLTFSAAAILIVFLHDHLFIDQLSLPQLPLAVVGAAIGIFVSFRTNSCYDRWWEGRKLWGRLINTSRHFTSQVLSYLPPGSDGPSDAQIGLIRRHVAYVHVLRCVLRGQDALADKDVQQYITQEEHSELANKSNQNHLLLTTQGRILSGMIQKEGLDERRLQSFDESLRALLDIQGGCERIKKTPFPRSYGFIADRLVVYYSFLFPMAIVDELGWFTVPISLLVTLSFALIGEVGRILEDPFNMFYNGLPLTAMSKTIERNLLEAAGVTTDLPEIPNVNSRGILM